MGRDLRLRPGRRSTGPTSHIPRGCKLPRGLNAVRPPGWGVPKTRPRESSSFPKPPFCRGKVRLDRKPCPHPSSVLWGLSVTATPSCCWVTWRESASVPHCSLGRTGLQPLWGSEELRALGVVLCSGALIAAESGPGAALGNAGSPPSSISPLVLGGKPYRSPFFKISFIFQQESPYQARTALLASDFCQPNKPNLNKTGSVMHLPLDSWFVFYILIFYPGFSKPL